MFVTPAESARGPCMCPILPLGQRRCVPHCVTLIEAEPVCGLLDMCPSYIVLCTVCTFSCGVVDANAISQQGPYLLRDILTRKQQRCRWQVCQPTIRG